MPTKSPTTKRFPIGSFGVGYNLRMQKKKVQYLSLPWFLYIFAKI